MENINTLSFNAQGMFVCLKVLVAFWKILSIYSKFYIDFWVQKCTSKVISPPVANLLVTCQWPVGLVAANCRQTVGRQLADCRWRGAVLHKTTEFKLSLQRPVIKLCRQNVVYCYYSDLWKNITYFPVRFSPIARCVDRFWLTTYSICWIVTNYIMI